jgi:peptidyl-prolyl cis-trans isomerase C
MKTRNAIAKYIFAWIGIVLFVGVSSCSTGLPLGSDPISGTQTMEAQLPTATASPTPIPMAFSINGQGFPLEAYQRELQRYAIVKESLDQNQQQEVPETYVLDNLIDQQLLVHAAASSGCTADEALVQQDWDQWISNLPEGTTPTAWLDSKGYTEAEFKAAIATSLLEGCQMTAIAKTVPYEAEQIRASQILVKDRTLTDGILTQLNVGVEFATLAYQYDPLTGGDLGWFPQGFLLEPAVEEAAFALQPGEFSPVIETELGFHILYVYQREIHPLSLDARRKLQQNALQDWLKTEREKSQIVISLP